MKSFITCFILIISSLFNFVTSDLCLSLEYTALQDLYNSTNGPSWTWTSSSKKWNFTSPCLDPCKYEWEVRNDYVYTCLTFMCLHSYIHTHTHTQANI